MLYVISGYELINSDNKYNDVKILYSLFCNQYGYFECYVVGN